MPEGVPSEYTIDVQRDGEMRYRGGRAGGATLLVDGGGEAAPSPVDALLVALASCAAIDVVEYLEKRRTPPSAVRVSVNFSRAPTPPRRITQAEVVFHVTAAAEHEHADRAAQLAFEKYCSVSASLAPDTALTWRVELQAPERLSGITESRD